MIKQIPIQQYVRFPHTQYISVANCKAMFIVTGTLPSEKISFVRGLTIWAHERQFRFDYQITQSILWIAFFDKRAALQFKLTYV